MTRDQLEELLRRLVSTGMAIAVVIGTAGPADHPDGPPTVAVEPAPARDGDRGDNRGDDRGDEDRTDDDRAEDRPGAGTGGEATSAAARHGWGRPDRVDEFTDGLGPDWNVYDGPGHAGNGRRDPDAVTVDDGVLTITGSPTGTTAGMSWGDGRKYGRWEGRVRAPEADDSYHALMLLWPDAEDFPVGGEIDFMEMLDGDRQRTNLFLHYGEDNSQIGGEVEVDATTWHNWALEWTPESITAYLDGEEWFRTTEREIFPPRAMHLAIQLDWFPDGEDERFRESRMEVDWVKQYPVDGAADDEDPSDADD